MWTESLWAFPESYREYPTGSSFPEGVLDFQGKIAWGCQISRGANFPVTPDRMLDRWQTMGRQKGS